MPLSSGGKSDSAARAGSVRVDITNRNASNVHALLWRKFFLQWEGLFFITSLSLNVLPNRPLHGSVLYSITDEVGKNKKILLLSRFQFSDNFFFRLARRAMDRKTEAGVGKEAGRVGLGMRGKSRIINSPRALKMRFRFPRSMRRSPEKT